MKIQLTLILFFSSIWLTPIYADYSDLKEAMNRYNPPVSFEQTLDFETQKESNVFSDQSLLPVTAGIEILKQVYTVKLEDEHHIEFLNEIDPALFANLLELSKDNQAVQGRIQDRVVLKDIQILAALRNPAIRAAQKSVRADIESFNQVMSLDENLRQYSAFTESLTNKVGPAKMQESIAFKYPYPGLTSLKGQIINHQAAISVQKMEIVTKEVITNIRKAYWNFVYIHTSQTITMETIDALVRLKDVATALYKSGKTSFQDVIKVNIKIAILKEELQTLEVQKKNIGIKILELLNLPPGTVVGRPVNQSVSKEIGLPQDLYALARIQRQELKVLKTAVSKTEKMIEMAESMIFAPFTLNLSVYEDQAVQMVGTDAGKAAFPEKTMASMKNSRPIQAWVGLDDPWLNQTKQKLLGLKQTLIKEENATDSLVQEAWVDVDKNKRELKLYESLILSLSKSALDVSTREYESGSTPFSEAINSYTSWLNVKLSIAKKQKDMGIAIAKLELIIGKSF